jgi:hypothetical protein
VGIFKSKKKMVAAANHFVFSSAWWTNNHYPGFCFGSVYLCNILMNKILSFPRKWESIAYKFLDSRFHGNDIL